MNLNIAAESVSPFPTRQLRAAEESRGNPRRHNLADVHSQSRGEPLHRRHRWQTGARLQSIPNRSAAATLACSLTPGAVEFRNIKLKPLKLESYLQWQGPDRLEASCPVKKSVFSVTPEGRSQRQKRQRPVGTRKTVCRLRCCQLDIFSNWQVFEFRHLLSQHSRRILGWLRESQIQNGYLKDDRTKPFDFGTVAIYRRSRRPARSLANDFEWFHKTLIADGPHMAGLDQRLPGDLELDRHPSSQ